MQKKTVRFFATLFLTAFLAAGLLSVCAYLYDPQNVYRWNTRGLRCYQPTFSAAGALNHYDYDLAVIGSSMVQNWDAQTLSEALDCKPLKLTIGAMTPQELLFLYERAHSAAYAARYIVNIDLHRIAAAAQIVPDSGRFPKVMFHPEGIGQFRYLLGFETWLRFMPVDLVCTAADRLPISSSIRAKIRETTDINAMCAWDETALAGTEKLLADFRAQESAFNEGNDDGFADDPVGNLHVFLQQMDGMTASSETLTLVLPPYSVLYWADKTPQEYKALLQMRLALAAFADAHENVTLIDCQSMPQIGDLSLYVDANHCGRQIRLLVERALADGSMNTDRKTMAESNAKLDRALAAFAAEYR